MVEVEELCSPSLMDTSKSMNTYKTISENKLNTRKTNPVQQKI